VTIGSNQSPTLESPILRGFDAVFHLNLDHGGDIQDEDCLTTIPDAVAKRGVSPPIIFDSNSVANGHFGQNLN
jgi:hypothetical protein